jgi:hypothetical protein
MTYVTCHHGVNWVHNLQSWYRQINVANNKKATTRSTQPSLHLKYGYVLMRRGQSGNIRNIIYSNVGIPWKLSTCLPDVTYPQEPILQLTMERLGKWHFDSSPTSAAGPLRHNNTSIMPCELNALQTIKYQRPIPTMKTKYAIITWALTCPLLCSVVPDLRVWQMGHVTYSGQEDENQCNRR